MAHGSNVVLMDSKLRVRARVPKALRPLMLVVALVTPAACSYSAEAAPRSSPAAAGASYEIVFPGCGGEPDGPSIVDFDGSLWLPVGADPAEVADASAEGDAYADKGSITLVAPDQAEYRSDRGRVFEFERQPGNVTFEGCVLWAFPPDEG